MPPPSPYRVKPSPSRARPSPSRTKRRTSEDGKEGTVVAIRMRPLNDNEGAKQRVWQVLPKNNAVFQTNRNGEPLDRIANKTYFNYNKTFGEEVQTAKVYDDVAKPIVTSVVNGLNGTIFAYGQTSSGKTYTMQGSGSIEDGSHAEGGIVHMAAKDIFSHIELHKDRTFLVRASFLEIYNEDVRDLLSNSTESLQIREDPRHGVFVQCNEEPVTTFESLLNILFHGEKSRQVASTGMNERSSRSHTIFRVTIESYENGDGDGESEKENDASRSDRAVLVSTLNLVDLAGSESVRHTGASGDRQKEGGMINQSLLTLSRVIQALGNPNQSHVMFRDSKLTRLLQPALSGNAKMAVICCATPSELYLEETRSTLQFASRASLVKTNAQVNEVLDDRSMVKRLQREIAELQRNSTAPGAQEIQAVEDKAAKEAKANLGRLTSCLLNAGHLFASTHDSKNSMVLSPAPVRMKLRKRRQSDGNLFTSAKSPLKLSQQLNIAPLTEPKRKKTRQLRQQASPKSQLSIVKEALSSRSNFARSLQDTVSNLKFVIQDAENRFKQERESNDSKMIEFQEQYAALQREHDRSQMENSDARDENAKLMDESVRVYEDYDAMKKQNSQLQQQLGQVLSDFDNQRQQNEAKMAELETLRVEISEVERLLRVEEEKAHEKDEHLAQTREQLSSFEVEQQLMKEQLGRQQTEFTAQNETQLVKTQSLQEEINRLQQEGETRICELSKLLDESATKLQESEDAAATEVASLESQLELQQEKMTEMQTEYEMTCAQKDTMQQDLEENLQSCRIELKTAATEKRQLENENTGFKKQRELLDEKIKELDLTVEQQSAEIMNLSAQKSDVEAKLETAETSLEAAEKEFEITRADMSSRIESLEEKLKESETENTQVKQENTLVKQELQDTNTKNEAMEQKITELTSSVQEQQVQIEKLDAEKTDLETRLETAETSLEDTEEELETTRANMNSRIESLEGTLRTSEVENTEIKQQFEETVSKNDIAHRELEDKLESMSKAKEQLEAKFADAGAEKSELRSQHQLLEEKITELAFSVEQHQAEIEKLHSEKKNLESILDEAEKSLEESEEQLEITRIDMTKHIEGLEKKLETAEAKTAEVKKEFEESSTQKEFMCKEVEEKLESMAAEKTELEGKLAEAVEEKIELQNQYHQSEENITELTSNAELIKLELEEVKAAKSDLEAKLETAEASLQHSDEQLEITRADMSSKMSSLDEKLKESEAELTQVKQELEDTTNKHHAASQELDGKLELMSETKVQLEAELAGAAEEKEERRNQQEKLEEKITELRYCLEEKVAEIEKLDVDKNDIESKLSSSENTVKESQDKISQLGVDLRLALERNLSIEEKLNSELKEKEVWKMNIEKRSGDVDEEFDVLRNEIASLRVEVQNAEQWKQNALFEQEKYEETIKDLQSLLDEQKKDAAALSKEHDEVCQMLGKAKDDGSVFEGKNSELWSYISDLGEKLLSIGNLLSEREEELEDLRNHWYSALHVHSDAHIELDGAQAKIQSMESSQENYRLETQERILQLQEHAGMANSSSKTAVAELNAVVQDLNKQKAQNQELEDTRKQLESNIERISIDLDKITSEKTSMQAHSSDAEEAIRELKAKLAQAENTILQIRNTNQVIIAEQEEAYKELESRLKKLFQGLESLKGEKRNLEDQIGQLENEKRELQIACESLSNDKDEIDKLLEHATRDLTENEATISQAAETINDLKSKKFDMETRIEELESGLDCQLQTLQEKLLETQSENEELRTQAEKVDVTTAQNRSEVMEIKTMTTAILAEKDAVEALLSESQLQVHQLEEQLDHARDEHQKVLTNTALQLDQKQKELEALIRGRDEAESNLNKRLKDRELERDEATAELQKLYNKNKELSQSIGSCVTKERETELESQVSNLKHENVELKQLLISANESEERSRKEVQKLEIDCASKKRELDDAFYRLSQMEEELQMLEIPQEREIDGSQEGLFAEFQEQKVELERILDQERKERQQAEEDLKRRMGEEQRLLIHEAEENFSELRNTTSDLETRLEQSESEGYQARQEAEELRDQNKEIEDKCIALEGAVSDLKSVLTEHEKIISVLQSDLNKAKAESYALKENAIDMKERARKASRESEKALRENRISSDEVVALKRKISSLEHDAAQKQEQYEHLQGMLQTAQNEAAGMDVDLKNSIKSKDEQIERLETRLVELDGESKRLAVELKMARVQIETQQTAEGDDELHKKIEHLTAQMNKKDSRIKKLEKVRLTKEQVESIKKMKIDSKRLEEECKRLTRKNSELLDQLESSGSQSSGSQSSSLEVDNLRSDKKALEKKLRKYVTHCQSLMDDKASMMDALNSCNIPVESDSDPNDAVIALCDKYREVKRSQGSSKGDAMLADLEKKNVALVAKIKEMEDIDRKFTVRAAQYQKEIELVKGSLRDAKEDLEETKSAAKREISTLKEEALQAICEKKAAKKKLQNVQAELEIMRMNASVDNPTVDFSVSDLQLAESDDDSPLKPKKKEGTFTKTTPSLSMSMPRKESRTPLGDATNGRGKPKQSGGVTKSENSNGILHQQIEKPALNSASKTGLAPGLGEAGATMYDDENTQECKQS